MDHKDTALSLRTACLVVKILCVLRTVFCILFNFQMEAIFWAIAAFVSGIMAVYADWTVSRFVRLGEALDKKLGS